MHTLALTYAIQNAKRESTLFVDKYLLLAWQSALSKVKDKLIEEMLLPSLSSQTLNCHAKGRTSFIFNNELHFP